MPFHPAHIALHLRAMLFYCRLENCQNNFRYVKDPFFYQSIRYICSMFGIRHTVHAARATGLWMVLFVFLRTISVQAQAGSIDTSFVTEFDYGGSQFISTLKVMPNLQIVAGGFFKIKTLNQGSIGSILRYHADGKYDGNATTGTGFDQNVSSISVFKDGSLLIAGSFTRYNDFPVQRLARLTPDFTLDTGFKPPVLKGVFGFAVFPDDHILAGVYDANGFLRMMKLKPDGSKVPDFYDGYPLRFYSALFVEEGKILAGGFLSGNQKDAKILMRLLPSGKNDSTFILDPLAGLGMIYGIARQKDGRIVVCGQDLKTQPKVLRLQSDGKLDHTFNPIVFNGVNNSIGLLQIQKDDKIIVGGLNGTFLGKKYNQIVRFMPDGQLDTTFITGFGFDARVNTLEFFGDDKIMAGGIFNEYNGEIAGKIIRLNLENPKVEEVKPLSVVLFPNPSLGMFKVEATQTINQIEITDAAGKKITCLKPDQLQAEIDLTGKAPGLYFVKIKFCGSSRMIKVQKG